MKKLSLLAVLAVLCLAIAPATFADATPTATADLGLLPLLGFEAPAWMTSGLVLSSGPQWCTDRNNQYCSYSWDRANACCRGTAIIWNSYCPDICY